MKSREIAEIMLKSYNSNSSQGAAIEEVKDKYPETDLNILWAMWYTIDVCNSNYK